VLSKVFTFRNRSVILRYSVAQSIFFNEPVQRPRLMPSAFEAWTLLLPQRRSVEHPTCHLMIN
jgi:hypothetical protein